MDIIMKIKIIPKAIPQQEKNSMKGPYPSYVIS